VLSWRGEPVVYPPSWFTGRLVSLKTRWEELNAPQASDQLSLAL